jgi:hypothetical protein
MAKSTNRKTQSSQPSDKEESIKQRLWDTAVAFSDAGDALMVLHGRATRKDMKPLARATVELEDAAMDYALMRLAQLPSDRRAEFAKLLNNKVKP